MAQNNLRRRCHKIVAALSALTVLAACTPADIPAYGDVPGIIGIADSDAATFDSADWPVLGVRDARAVAPWDVARQPRDATTPGGARRIQLESWLAAAARAKVRPVVTFELSAGRRDAPPTLNAYREAMVAFRTAYPDVTTLGAWNEPNDPQLASSVPDPALAVGYWATLREVCPACTVLAGEFAGIPGDPYVPQYVKSLLALKEDQPTFWAFHDHTDVNRFQAGTDQSAPAARYLLAQLPRDPRARIWITEVGAYYRNAEDRVFGDRSQARAVAFVLGLPTLDPRITAVYYYNFANDCPTAQCPHQDRGLVAPMPASGPSLGYDVRGRRRCALSIFARRGPFIKPAAELGDIAKEDPASSAC